MNKQFLKENKWKLLTIGLHTVALLGGITIAVKSIKKLKGGK